MYLGRKINSFRAEDSGIVAPGLQLAKVEAAEELQAELREIQGAPEILSGGSSVTVEVPVESTVEAPVSAEERQRLWSLVGLLRVTNAKLRRTVKRLTKENEALRSERSDREELTVASILGAESRESVSSN